MKQLLEVGGANETSPPILEPRPMTAVEPARAESGATESAVFSAIERAWDAGVLVFAGFTLLVHTFVFGVNGTFGVLRWLALALTPLVYLAFRVTRPRRDAGAQLSVDTPQPVMRVDKLAHLFVACLIVLVIPLSGAYLPFWLGAGLYLAIVYLRSFSARELLLQRSGEPRPELLALGTLVLLSMVLTGISHRPDTDDGFLINLSVWMLDNPNKVLQSEDGLHNLASMPIAFPTYRAHALEVLYGWLAWLLHLQPITIAHMLLAPLSAALAVLSSALLLRVLLPRGWALALTALAGFWVSMGDTHDGFANHAYVRIFQGKAVLVTALLPYLVFSVIRFMQSGRALHWVLVFAAVVCGVGLSATGLFVAPLALGAAAAAAWKPTRRDTLRFVATLACAAYAIALALHMRSEVIDKLAILNGDALYGHVKTFADSYVQILGHGPYMYLHVLGVLAAPALAPDHARRRWLAALGLVYFALVMNPFLYPLWVKYVTSAPVAWRLWWMIPVPILVCVSLAAPFAGDAGKPRQLALFGCLLLAAYTVVPSIYALSGENGVRFALPGLKVPPRTYALAKTVCRLTPDGYSVLAPRELTMWITTQRNHPRVVAHKQNTLKVMEPYMGPEQFQLRMHLFLYIMGAGRGRHSAQVLANALDPLHIGMVVHSGRLPWYAEVYGVMSAAGFRRKVDSGYVLWVRDTARDGG